MIGYYILSDNKLVKCALKLMVEGIAAGGATLYCRLHSPQPCFLVYYEHAWPDVAMCDPGRKPEARNNPYSFGIILRVLDHALKHRQLCTAPDL